MNYIALVELFGFSEFILSNDLDGRLRYYSKFISSVEELFEASELEEDQKHWKESLIAVNQGNHLLIWTDDDTPRAFGDLIVGIRNILPIALFAGFPPKAIIGVGTVDEIQRDNDGPAFAHTPIFLSGDIVRMQIELSKHLWSGCVIARNAIDYFHASRSAKTVSIGELTMMKILAQYSVPGSSESNYVINWIDLVPNTIPLEMLEFFFNRCTNDLGAKRFQMEVKNTYEFITTMQSPMVN